MSVRLSSRDLAQLRRATQVLLSPLRYDSVDAWRRDVNRELRLLVGADSMGFLLPVADGRPVYSEEIPADTLAPFPELLPPSLADGTPAWQRAIELGVVTLEVVYGDDVGRYFSSAYYHEFALPGGAAQSISVAMPIGDVTPAGAASVQGWRERGSRARFGERELALLRLVEPAFRAGVEGWLSFGGRAGALVRTIDLLDQPVMSFDAAGRVVHATGAVERLLRDDPQGEEVRQAMVRMGRQLAANRPLAKPAERHATCGGVVTAAGSYVLHCCRGDLSAGESILLVSVRREQTRPRTAGELRAAFGLTAREAAVARLLARGRRNAEVAAELRISPHTAKRHTERILAKLGAKSRAEVAGRIDT
jgi:DNA-binding CsgD family transcriptional regulator